MSELRPSVKFIGLPVIFAIWLIQRLLYTQYVTSSDFMEYWEEL